MVEEKEKRKIEINPDKSLESTEVKEVPKKRKEE